MKPAGSAIVAFRSAKVGARVAFRSAKVGAAFALRCPKRRSFRGAKGDFGAARRRGLTLLELVVASALMTTVATAAALLLRGVHGAWDAHEGDYLRIEAAHATLRHAIRQVRQAQSVTAISAAGNTAGTLSVVLPSGSTVVWARNATTSQVNYGVGAANQLLAEGIAELSFTGYKADGTTATAVPAEIQAVKCRVRVDLPRDAGGARTVTGWAWLRSW